MIPRDQMYERLALLALEEFGDIVEGTKLIEGKLRLLFIDGSFVDIWLSAKKEGVYAYHWERKMVDGTIYRHNNLPDREARKLRTFPKHFHNRSEKNVLESDLSDNPDEAVKSLLRFARGIIQ